MRPQLFRVSTLILFSLLPGCGDDPSTPNFETHPVTLTPTRQWAGGEITLRTAAFQGWPEEFPLMVGGNVEVMAHRTDDTTYAATLPDTLAGGAYLLQSGMFESPGFEVGLEVAGWTDTRVVPLTGTSGYSTPWPVAAPTGLILVKDDTIRWVNATDGVVTTFPATTTTFRTPLGFDAEGRILAPLNNDTILAWWLDPIPLTATALDTFARTADPDFGHYHLASGDWVVTDHDQLSFPDVLYSLSYATSPRPVMAAAGGRLVVPHRSLTPDQGGIPIFATDSGTPAAKVLGYSRLDAATFSGAGTALYVAAAIGGLASTTQSLLKVDPLTGAIQDSVPAIARPGAEALALDGDRGLLFEAIADTTHWTLRVRDAATLDLVALLRSPTIAQPCFLEAELHIIQVGDVVYLGTAGCNAAAGDIRFARFTLK
jgi:hypothetical protein